MSNYTEQKNIIMPKITKSLRNENRNFNERKSYTRNEEQYFTKIKNSNNAELLDNEKKPSSSIDRKKPKYIFPKIIQSKVPTTTSSSIISGTPIQIYKINNLKRIKLKKTIFNEIDKNENTQNNNKININHNINSNNMNFSINQFQPSFNNDNEFIEEKKLINNKTPVDINNYKDISINFLVNNSELSQMFEKLYNNDYNTKKKWVDLNLFGKEVFKIRLETYIKNKMDIPSFIKNEIQKLLSNQYCDYIFAQSYKEIQTQYDEHLKNIENIYN